VDESAVARLKPGQSVNVTFDSLAGRQFQGTVAVVTPSGVTQQGVVTFPVQIVFNAQGVTIPAGATATLRIVTESRPNALAVPSRAVQRQGGSSVVQVLEDGEPVARTVRTGITADNFTEITEGLQEGETVVIQTAQTGATGQQSGTFGTGGLGGAGGGPVAVPAGPR
jgi:multidrug efflux pump subunit AcrA (membrane-fusion protein)